MRIRGPIRYVVVGAIAGAIVTGTALAHDSSDHSAEGPGAIVPGLEQNAASAFMPLADGNGGIVTDADGRVALVSRAGIERLLTEIADEGGVARDPHQPDAVPTVRIADHLDQLVAARAVEFVAADDPRLLAVLQRRGGRRGPLHALTAQAVGDRLAVVEARVRALLEGDLHDECFGRGAQVSVSTPFGRFDVAAGESRPGVAMRVDTLHNIWCGTKPIVAVAVLAALEGAGLSAETRLAQIDPVLYRGIDVSVGAILRHDAGLRQPDGITAQFLDLPNRRRAVFDAARDAMPEPVYSEYAGWYLLADVLARVHGSSPSAALHAAFGGAVCGGAMFDIPGGELARRRQGIGPYYTGVPGALVPSFHDRSGAVALGDRPALGGYVSMQSLLDFYLNVAAVVNGRSTRGFPSPSTLRRAIGDRRVTVDDPVIKRRCAFGGGFMVELADHGYGAAVSSSAIGHSGLMGNSCGLVDPRSGVALALFFNGFNGGPADADFLRSRYVATVFGETVFGETVIR